MKRWFNGLWAAAKLECRYTRHHPQQWVICALMPVIWLIVVAQTFGTGLMTKLPVGIVNQDSAVYSREVVMLLDSVPSFGLKGYDNVREAQAALARAETYATIVIPEHFTRDSLNGQGSTIEFIVNKSYYAIGTILEVDLKQALAAYQKQAGAKKITIARGGTLSHAEANLRLEVPEVYFMGNQGFNFVAYLLPTLIPGLIALVAGITFAGVLVREWRDGGAQQLLESANGFATAAILGKLFPWFIFYCALGFAWVGGIAGWLGWAPAGSLVLWLIATLCLVAAMGAIAVMLTSTSISWPIGVSAVICVSAPSFPFTGFSYPLESMTPGASFFGDLLPLTHYLAIQGQCWVLNSPLDHTMNTFVPLLLLIAIPMGAGLPILSVRLRTWAKKDADKARLVQLLSDEGALAQDNKAPVKENA